MKPGRELDALVAENVMGLHAYVTEWGPYEVYTEQSRSSYPCPAYSTDIAAAWAVVEKLKTIPGMPDDWGDDYTEPFPIEIKYIDNQWRVSWSPTYWISEHCASADTAPHAICLAALKAVQKEMVARVKET